MNDSPAHQTSDSMPLVVNDESRLFKHLEFIELAITRMAANSFVIKGWTATLVSAILAFTALEKSCRYAWIAAVPLVAFWVLDGFYLRKERLFRKLYEDVAAKPSSAVDFSMDTSPYETKVQQWPRVCFSRTLLLFYLPILVVASAVVFFVSK